jgi:hypothetical protein
MDTTLRTLLWSQFGASLDMLENAVAACPPQLWDTGTGFWYIAYHTLFYTDYYLSEEPDGFQPPAPFGLSEFDPSGAWPERTYTQQELLRYLDHNKQKAHHLIARMDDTLAAKRFINPYRNYSILELLLYNMRHIQHHGGQLHMLIKQGTGADAPRWVAQARSPL